MLLYSYVLGHVPTTPGCFRLWIQLVYGNPNTHGHFVSDVRRSDPAFSLNVGGSLELYLLHIFARINIGFKKIVTSISLLYSRVTHISVSRF